MTADQQAELAAAMGFSIDDVLEHACIRLICMTLFFADAGSVEAEKVEVAMFVAEAHLNTGSSVG